MMFDYLMRMFRNLQPHPNEIQTHRQHAALQATGHPQPTRQQKARTDQQTARVITNNNLQHDHAPVQPPAKNTSPDANDAAAKWPRACPRPAGNVVQLLLVALYMSK
jgi:hypothetical protein